MAMQKKPQQQVGSWRPADDSKPGIYVLTNESTFVASVSVADTSELKQGYKIFLEGSAKKSS